MRSVNWYVQMLYGTNKGTNVVSLTENGKPVEGKDGLYASAVWDKSMKRYIVKIANTGDQPQQVTFSFRGAKISGQAKVTTLHADDPRAVNTLDKPNNVVPQQSSVEINGNACTVTIPAKTFAVYRF